MKARKRYDGETKLAAIAVVVLLTTSVRADDVILPCPDDVIGLDDSNHRRCQ